jgi:hypothetical protein
MNSRLILAASIALAFAAPAFAQGGQTPPASPAGDQSAPADSQPTGSDNQQPAMKKRHRHVTHESGFSGPNGENPAAERLTGNEPGTAAYQASPNREKRFPAVDHGHVHGDPPVIDHSADHAQVAPTTTSVTVPPPTH